MNIIEWNRDTGEIIETCGVAEVVIGYADDEVDAQSQIDAIKDRIAFQQAETRA